jgi:hypothetical protein
MAKKNRNNNPRLHSNNNTHIRSFIEIYTYIDLSCDLSKTSLLRLRGILSTSTDSHPSREQMEKKRSVPLKKNAWG